MRRVEMTNNSIWFGSWGGGVSPREETPLCNKSPYKREIDPIIFVTFIVAISWVESSVLRLELEVKLQKKKIENFLLYKHIKNYSG